MTGEKLLKRGTFVFPSGPRICGWASAVGKKEGEGPLGGCFDEVWEDTSLGQRTWERAESRLQERAFELALEKCGKTPDLIFAGDLLDQCVASSLAHKSRDLPYLGIYGACSTMAQGLLLGAMAVDGGFSRVCAAVTSSHFCSAERQYRMPLDYGAVRPPTSQRTCTAAGCVLISSGGQGPIIRAGTVGSIVDAGVTDAADMGAAMAPAALETLVGLFDATGTSPEDYGLILTGDLGATGAGILRELMEMKGLHPGKRYADCGELIFSPSQDTHSGGSGCGCSAAVLCGRVLDELSRGMHGRVIFAGTGALLSPTSLCQGESISGICHGVILERGVEA